MTATSSPPQKVEELTSVSSIRGSNSTTTDSTIIIDDDSLEYGSQRKCAKNWNEASI